MNPHIHTTQLRGGVASTPVILQVFLVRCKALLTRPCVGAQAGVLPKSREARRVLACHFRLLIEIGAPVLLQFLFVKTRTVRACSLTRELAFTQRSQR